jgi:hypothetical protein
LSPDAAQTIALPTREGSAESQAHPAQPRGAAGTVS